LLFCEALGVPKVGGDEGSTAKEAGEMGFVHCNSISFINTINIGQYYSNL
jgi:hypothetical protein